MEKMSLGALAPKIDIRDYKVKTAFAASYPEEYELEYISKIKNQGSVGSCVAHASSSILEYFNQKENGSTENLSTDFIYGMQGIAFDRLKGGMYLRDACKIVQQFGDCYQTSIPTNTEQPKCTEQLKEKLTPDIYKEAYAFRVKSYAKCANEKEIKHAIMNYGPILGSVKWYDKNSKGENGIINMDLSSDYGYHAIMVYGWNKDGWLCQNSWGKTWNGNGKFVQPYSAGLVEAWSFVDETNSDIVTPKTNKYLSIIQKIINKFINFIRKFF